MIAVRIMIVNLTIQLRNGVRYFASVARNPMANGKIIINNLEFEEDKFTNINQKILSYLNRNLHTEKYHPLSLVRQKIVKHFNKMHITEQGTPIFAVYDSLSPIVTVQQNFDSLLIPKNHPSRAKSDCYYINENYLLRAHTTAHQSELLQAGKKSFLIFGDVYRRDEIDKTHYPVFHQVDCVYLKKTAELPVKDYSVKVCTNEDKSTQQNQDCHSLEAVKIMEYHLKSTLECLTRTIFGQNVKYRWVETSFPFTQPSWELEVQHASNWMEVLGCGIMKQDILENAGISNFMGWAFGIGLERLAMHLYNIPDIRLFWSKDSGFLNQFITHDINKAVKYQPISQYPQCINNISFWLPNTNYSSSDFYDVVRNVGGDIVEQVSLIDEFYHPKSKKISHCYKIVYRHMEKTLTQCEVNRIHKEIEKAAIEQLKVIVR